MAVLTLPHCFPLQSVNGRNKGELKQSKCGGRRWCTVGAQQQELCTQFERIRIDKSALKLEEACSDAELWATSLLRFSDNGEDRVVVGTLDLNRCLSLPNEITGIKPKGIEGDIARGYLSNVCVVKECQRNGLGLLLVEKSKSVAQDWGISDLYVHVAVDNNAARNLYTKCGFTYESEEPAWQARFLDRPRRLLLWIGIPNH